MLKLPPSHAPWFFGILAIPSLPLLIYTFYVGITGDGWPADALIMWQAEWFDGHYYVVFTGLMTFLVLFLIPFGIVTVVALFTWAVIYNGARWLLGK